MINIKLEEREIKLIKEALTTTMVKYVSDSTLHGEDMGSEWVYKTISKAEDMESLLNKF